MIKTLPVKCYEVCDALQTFLLNNADFEQFLNTLGYTNNESPTLKRVNYVHYPKQTLALKDFPFITIEANESRDERRKDEGFMWNIEIVIGVKDLAEDGWDSQDHEKTVVENVTKYIATRKIQDIAEEVVKAIGEEIEFSGIKGDFEIEFGRISHSTTPTGEFDPVYHLIELELISYKEI